MINNVEKQCMGCGACANICPVNAITMVFNDYGFYSPKVVEEKCIKCGNCLKVCAALDYKSNNKEPQVYAVAAQDKERVFSTSGAAFAVLAKYVLKNNGYVCGVAWNNNWEAEHIIINKIEDLQKLRFSKYVQATTGDSYKKIKELLKNGKLVLFSGTPCQNAGLSKFLNKDYPNLITVDILCHGAPSPKVWQDYLNENFDKNKIVNINFRKKDNGWVRCNDSWFSSSNSSIDLLDGTKTPIGIYYEAFIKHLLSNDACMECKYKHIPRPADFTLGDFWNRYNDKKLNDGKGLGVLLCNNKKANMILKEVLKDFKLCKKINLKKKWDRIEITNNTRDNYARNEFFKDYQKNLPLSKLLNTGIGKKYDIGLITQFNFMNYGSGLVAYAAYQLLRKFNLSILMIDKDMNGYDHFNPNNRSLEFAKKHYHISNYYAQNDDSRNLNDLCETFIVASDTMWWDTEYARDFCYLDFVRSEKRKISLCTSFGHIEPAMDENARAKRRWLFNRFDALSVREETGVKNLKEIFNTNAEHLYDPTLIVDKEIFDKLADKSTKKLQNFLFAYMLDLTPEKEKIAKHVADSLGLNLKLISNMRYQGDSNLIDEKNISIEDFVYYCKNASFIITDSFHGSCFSTIYQKPFVSIVNSWRGVARYKIFKDMGLGSQIINNIDDIYKIEDFKFKLDFSLAQKILAKEKYKAEKWIKEALEKSKDNPTKEDMLYDYIYNSNFEINNNTHLIKNELTNKINELKFNWKKLLNTLFSVKNNYKYGIKRKIITILGIKICYKTRRN